MLGRVRLGALIGVIAVGGVLAFGLADCAEPTQIEIDVRTDACKFLKNAGIAVTTRDKLEDAQLSIFTPDRPDNAGCESKPADRVGTLIIYPSGAKDAEVAIRIVGGITRTAQECSKDNYAGCVVARRIERFVPGSTKKVIVILSRACEGKDCGLGQDCDPSGSCVVNLEDGGTADAGNVDAQPVADAAEDAPEDAPPADAGYDACVNCVGGQCTAGSCKIDCNDTATCGNKAVCGADLDCIINCNATSSCTNTSCAAGSKSCAFNCVTGTPACNGITCVAPACSVTCVQDGRCDGVIHLGGGDAGISCSGNQSCGTVDNLTCDAGTCNIACGASCPDPRSCAAGSTCNGDWTP